MAMKPKIFFLVYVFFLADGICQIQNLIYIQKSELFEKLTKITFPQTSYMQVDLAFL